MTDLISRMEKTSRCGVRLLVLLAGCLAGCVGGGGGGGAAGDGGGAAAAPAAPRFDATLVASDEAGRPVATATVTVGGQAIPVDAAGRATLASLDGPVVAVVEAAGYLPEPLVVDRDGAGATLTARLLARDGPGGRRRVVMHFAGDLMLGRRYETPTRAGTAVVTPGDGGASARAVVSSIAPLFSAAHIRAANLETVVGTLPAAAAYPKKRFLLQSPPELVQALLELRANLLVLGNNHSRDWLEDGLASTSANLDAGGLPYCGAGLDEAAAAEACTVTAAGIRIGFLSYTTVNGDFVNDSLPSATDPVPAGLDPAEAWQYELRTWGFQGAEVTAPTADRRIGPVWELIVAAEARGISSGERAALWASATAVYPELQDWVARRGHGGANGYPGTTRVRADVAALRAQGAELVVVQFHAGHQFSEVKSAGTELATHAAIDAGADLVVCHHPHVLQGLEWYKGKLIAQSLGNFVFDQDFLATFPAAILRVVFEESTLLEARLYPTVLDAYRPEPLGGRAARAVVGLLAERSALEAHSDRVGDGVRAVLAPRDPAARMPRFVRDGASVLLLDQPPAVTSLAVTATADRATDLPPGALTRGGPTSAPLLYGRDLFSWGSFEDDTADGADAGGTHWALNGTTARVEAVAGAPSGVRALRLSRTGGDRQRVLARPVARVPLPAHRFYDDTGSPKDGPASFALRLHARRDGAADAEAIARFDVYHFDDSNPTEDPDSVLLRAVEAPLPIPADGAWHDIEVRLEPAALAPVAGKAGNYILFYLALRPPAAGEAVLYADDVQLLEWRDATLLPEGFYLVDCVKARDPGATVPALLERQEY
jgi:poly-gamma-glutamate capsule biosynthesis protein CapA/YwtB (metallophosphatase superfamily)